MSSWSSVSMRLKPGRELRWLQVSKRRLQDPTSTETIATFLSKYHPILQLLLAHFSGVCGGTVTNSPDERKQISKRSRNCFICQKKFMSARTAIPQIDVDITLASAPRALPEVRRLTAVTRRSPYPTTCPEFSDHTTTAICAFNYCDAYQRWLYCSKQPGLMSTARRVPSPVRVVLDKGSHVHTSPIALKKSQLPVEPHT